MPLPPLYAVNEITEEIRVSSRIQIPDWCNGYLAVNKGDAPVKVNNFTLLPAPVPPGHLVISGESKGFIGNLGEVFTGENGIIQIVFDLTAAPTAPLVLITFKYYIPDYKNIR